MPLNLDTKIAFLGMGLMGTRMATRLLQAGFRWQSGTVHHLPVIPCWISPTAHREAETAKAHRG